MKTHALLVLLLLWVPSCKGDARMIPPFATGGFVQRGTVNVGAGAIVPYTSLWLPAGSALVPVGEGASPLLDLTANDMDTVYDVDPLQTISGYDEIYIHITNRVTAGGVGNPIVVRFAWVDGSAVGLRFQETFLDNALPASGPPVAGASDNNGLVAGAKLSHTAANVRRFTPSAAEFGPIEVGTGRVIPLRVKHAMLWTGISTVGGGAQDIKQWVAMQLVPRTIGVTRGGGG
jgi:hypothetical protein